MIVTSETIKNAIVMQILREMPDVNIYKESTATPQYPHCVVNIINVGCQEERKGYYLLTYNIMLQYREVADASASNRLQQALDKATLELMIGFDLIPVADTYVRCVEKSAEKVDGVLYFSFNIQLLVNKVELDEMSKVDKMLVLDYNIHVKE